MNADKSGTLRPWPLVALLGLIGGGMAAAYSSSTRPGQATAPVAPAGNTVAAEAPRAAPSVDQLVGPLAQRLADNPDDASGWAVLGKSYDYLGRHRDAANAYREAIARGHADPAIEDALREVENALITAALGAGGQTGFVNSPEPLSSPSIRGHVAVSEALSASVDPQDTVFVSASAAGGPPMPIAVIRTQASALPAQFTLDDSAAMMAGRSLADADQVIVTARISRTGNATRQAGDLIAHSAAVRPGSGEPVSLLIDSVIGDAQ